MGNLAKPLPALERLIELVEYDAETGLFKWRTARGTKACGAIAGHVDRRGYVRLGIDGALYAAHRLAWLMHYGQEPPPDLDIDHINLDTSDNRISNLRIATRAQNKINSPARADCKSGIKGVRFYRGRWEARIFVLGKLHCIGSFSSAADAAAAYEARAKSEFGEFARYNEK